MEQVTLTVACPEADREDAVNLAVALGWTGGWLPEEWQHAFAAQRQDASGNLYRVMSMPVAVSFVARATMMGPIERPPQDVDPGPKASYVVNLTGARRAQSKLVTWQPSNAPAPAPTASPDQIVAVVGLSGRDALAAMGLS